MRLECKTCGGVYDDLLADGMRYFHVCPPVTFVLVTRNNQPLYVQPANLKPTDRVDVLRAGARVEIVAIDIVPDEIFADERDGPRPGHRNENVIADGPDQGKPIAAKADKSDVVILPAVVDAPFDNAPVIVP